MGARNDLHTLPLGDRRCTPKTVGGKAAVLSRLCRRGYAVPPGVVLPWKSLRAADRDGSPLRGQLERSLGPMRDLACAVRSSADVEDAEAHSFAGQFLTLLDVEGDELADAIARVAGPHTGAASSYADRVGTDLTAIHMSVIVQQMVRGEISGVAFSRNPMTGVRETVVEAVRGSGEGLVRGEITPSRWVRSRGAWRSTPRDTLVPPEVAAALVTEIADGVESFEGLLGYPVDAEWSWDGRRLWWLQARPITGLHGITVYSNRLSHDMLPGIIRPLVWSVNAPLVCEAFLGLVKRALGPHDLTTDDVARLFHYRAYFNLGAFAPLLAQLGMADDAIEILSGIQPADGVKPSMRPSPRAIWRVPHVMGMAMWLRGYQGRTARWVERERVDFRRAAAVDPSELPADEVLARIDELFPRVQQVAVHTIATPMLMRMYSMRLGRALASLGIDADPSRIAVNDSGAAAHGPGAGLDRLHEQYRALPADLKEAVASGDVATIRADSRARGFADAVEAFTDEFGHFSDSGVDLSVESWRERPDLVLRMIADRAPARERHEQLDRSALQEAGARRSVLRLYDRAAGYEALRDNVSSLYTLAYGLFRPHYLALASALVAAGCIEEADDVFYLTADEVRRAVEALPARTDLVGVACRRRAEVDAARRIVPPDTIGTGEEFENEEFDPSRLRGVPTSKGRHTGRVVQARGIADIGRVSDGDVLVVPFSDVGWTPLYTRAGAVVAESGGFLSHSSIVAREYGIPAVVSARGACSIPEGALVMVDGFSGEVVVLEECAVA